MALCSKPRSWILVALLLVCTACVYFIGSGEYAKFKPHLQGSARDSQESKLNSETQLAVPESITLMSSNSLDKVKIHSSGEEGSIFHTDTSVHGTQEQGVHKIGDVLSVSEESKTKLDATSQQLDSLDVHFDPNNDTLILIHIQKTAGSQFARHLVTVQRDGQYLCSLSAVAKNGIEHNIKNGEQGLKGVKGLTRFEVSCPHERMSPDKGQWLITEKTSGWLCGTHATLMEFEDCLPTLNIKGPVHFALILRHPVLRYISEYLHVQRNATWPIKRFCDGKLVTEDEMPTCFPGFYQKKHWENLDLDKFMSCESNWANNRQTMALADLKVVGCYDRKLYTKEERERLILKSAKDNLRQLAFFGLAEYLTESCTLFEKIFNVSFAVKVSQKDVSELHSAPLLQDLWNNTTLFERVLSVNRLDLELYEYAFELFTERVKSIGIEIDREVVDKQVAQLTPKAIGKIIRKYKKLNYKLPTNQ